MKKTLIVLIAVLFAALNMIPAADAAERPDPEGRCAVTFTMAWNEEPMADGALTLYRVCELVEQDGAAVFAPVPALRESGLSLEELDDPALAAEFARLAGQLGLQPVTAQISQGKAVFTDLLPGIYVVTQAEEEASTGYSPIAPFLLSMPRWDGERYVYELTAGPKVAPQIQPTQPETVPPTEPGPTEPELPDTGQLNWPVPMMAIGGVVLFFVGWLLCFGKRGHR